jgi:hypothetical protein
MENAKGLDLPKNVRGTLNALPQFLSSLLFR